MSVRVLWISDSPFLATGFGRVTRELTSRLAVIPGLEVACLGWGYDGWPYDLADYPARVYPAANDCRGDEFERAVNDFQPDVVISLAEIWMIQWLHSHPVRGRFRWIAYLPIDSGPVYPPWEPILMGIDEIVVMSRFGQEVLRQGLPSKRTHLIYHGVNTSCFRPLQERNQLKQHERFRDRFIIGCVARNQPRKNIPALVKAFALLKDRLPDLHLYLHMNPCDVGYDLVTLLRRYGLHGRADVSNPEFSLTQGFPDEQLNRLYNLFDLTVLPSNAEGFGLPIIESLAAGVPVVATDFSACTELVRGRGELVKILTTMTVGTNLVEHAIIDVEDLARCIEKLYRNSELREQYAVAGRQFAESLSWDLLIPQWLDVLSQVTGKTFPSP